MNIWRKKPAFWIICVSIIAFIVVAVFFLTKPKENDSFKEIMESTVETETVETETVETETVETETKVSEDMFGNPISYSEYTYELIFNFGGRFFLSDGYEEPVHGDNAPKGWYMLGGEGECLDPSFAERETFVDGKLTAYNWLDNHSDCRAVRSFSVGKYSCCLYQYSFDLFTAPELELQPDAEPISKYWVVFYTEGEGKPLYVRYFNCDNFTQEQAMNNIVPGMPILSGTEIDTITE